MSYNWRRIENVVCHIAPLYEQIANDLKWSRKSFQLFLSRKILYISYDALPTNKKNHTLTDLLFEISFEMSNCNYQLFIKNAGRYVRNL